jgi:hypothetical protein
MDGRRCLDGTSLRGAEELGECDVPQGVLRVRHSRLIPLTMANMLRQDVCRGGNLRPGVICHPTLPYTNRDRFFEFLDASDNHTVRPMPWVSLPPKFKKNEHLLLAVIRPKAARPLSAPLKPFRVG